MTDHQRQRVHRAMVRLAEGDRDAFEYVFDELWPNLLAFTRRAMPGDADAEDLAQQALLKVFSGIAEFDTARDGVAWAFGIAAYEVRTHRRQVQRRREAADTFDGVRYSGQSPEQAVVEEDLVQALKAALGKLSASDREILEDVEHRSSGPVDAAGRKRRQRAIERLRAIWRKLYA